MGKSENSSAVKTTAVVIGALGLAWMTLELAFKPFLDQARKAFDKSDPTRDPDDDQEAVPVVVDPSPYKDEPLNPRVPEEALK